MDRASATWRGTVLDTSQLEVLDIAERDMDVPLSPLGVEQATAFGAWMRRRARRRKW